MFYEKILFTEDECNKILNYRFDYPNLYVTPENSLINGTRTVYDTRTENGNSWLKKYKVWDIIVDKNTSWFYNRIYDWFEDITQLKIQRFITNDKTLFAHKLHEYNKGDRFDRHIDNIGSEWNDRIWNFGIVLNSDFEGGEYVCYDEKNNPYTFKKITGNVVAYSSDIEHEITEITEGKRYSMVIKLHDWELETKKLKTLF